VNYLHTTSAASPTCEARQRGGSSPTGSTGAQTWRAPAVPGWRPALGQSSPPVLLLHVLGEGSVGEPHPGAIHELSHEIHRTPPEAAFSRRPAGARSS